MNRYDEFQRRVAEIKKKYHVSPDQERTLASRFDPPPKLKGHLGKDNPAPEIYDPAFIEREWAAACKGDIMTYQGRNGMYSPLTEYQRAYDDVTKKYGR